ncbi:hypothetical protein CIHG_03294 [Coccidioides immitis H538.4]|uniref:Uncharacterized protein n=3 Tax=Coccidioides immitis TaxID=5501 RepID=A0A0J8R5C3_COCIT|nr:hypothetical protein CIRG_00989 [Coccidioides immitis RMSCC 2394]KMU80001.1 hypothetical protein CISG_08161 [Coccidioides immitis RMSCC 3703]KMU85511.1 hypothetical protein CIHG_03294 [Coccidioides immitis H538.4]
MSGSIVRFTSSTLGKFQACDTKRCNPSSPIALSFRSPPQHARLFEPRSSTPGSFASESSKIETAIGLEAVLQRGSSPVARLRVCADGGNTRTRFLQYIVTRLLALIHSFDPFVLRDPLLTISDAPRQSEGFITLSED